MIYTRAYDITEMSDCNEIFGPVGQSMTTYRKREKIRWVKLSRFLSLPRKFSREILAIGK